MKLFTNSLEPDTSLGVIERGAYMFGNVGTALVNTIVATFLMFFYTDVMVLNPAIIGTILLVSRVFDGVTDLIMGMIVDRTFTKYGRARVWILRTCIPFAISGILLVCVPGSATEVIQYVYVFLTYNLFNTIFLTALYVPYNTMTCNMTTKPYERGLLGVFVMVGATLGTLIVQSTVIKATAALGGDQRAWQIVVSIYAVLGLCLHLVCFLLTKERTLSDINPGEKHKVDIKTEFKSVLMNRYWLIAIAFSFAALIFTTITGSSGIYYAKAVLGNEGSYAVFMNAMTITQLAVLFLAFIPMKKFGKRNTVLIGSIIMLIACVLQMIVPSSLNVITVCSVLKGIGGGLAGACLYGIAADTIDYGEWKTGFKAEGIGMAALTIVTKISNGLAGALVGWIISAGGYDATAVHQSASAISAVNVAFTIIPLIAVLAASILMYFYKLDKIYPQIQKELMDRKKNINIAKGENNEKPRDN